MRVFIFVFLMYKTLLATHPIVIQDSIEIIPKLPTTQDSIEIKLYNSDLCPVIYYNHKVSVPNDSTIFLSYEIKSCTTCGVCVHGSGSSTSFSSAPLPAGAYTVYKLQGMLDNCLPGGPCADYLIAPQRVGRVVIIEDDTYTASFSNITCITEPCSYFKVVSNSYNDTTLVAGIRTIDGSYLDSWNKSIVPWRDLGYSVKGYFDTDSLSGWITSAKVFIIAEVLQPTNSASELRQNKTLTRYSIASYNPFSQSITVSVQSNKGAMLTVLDRLGRVVRNSIVQQGNHAVSWDGKDRYGHSVVNGVYILQLKYADKVITQQILKIH